jgi:prophage antirepressor-like protein
MESSDDQDEPLDCRAALIDGLDVTHKVRVVTVEGDPWFVAADVCRVLGITTTANATRPLGADERGMYLLHTLGGPQKMTIISRPGLSKLILRSDKPVARPFQDWVTREVLEGVYATGSFTLEPGETIPLPASFADALRLSAATMIKLAEEQEAHAKTQAERDAAQAAKCGLHIGRDASSKVPVVGALTLRRTRHLQDHCASAPCNRSDAKS